MLSVDLIGTVHRDFEGPRRLRAFLDYLAPDVVSVELCAVRAQLLDRGTLSKVLDERMAEEGILRSECNEETIAFFLQTDGFEYFVARDYCAETNSLLILNDTTPRRSRSNLTFLTYAPEEIQRCAEARYTRALSGSILSPGDPDVPELTQRDQRAAVRIRDLDIADGFVHAAHVGGLAHIFDTSYANLSTHFQGIPLGCYPLSDADTLQPRDKPVFRTVDVSRAL